MDNLKIALKVEYPFEMIELKVAFGFFWKNP